MKETYSMMPAEKLSPPARTGLLASFTKRWQKTTAAPTPEISRYWISLLPPLLLRLYGTRLPILRIIRPYYSRHVPPLSEVI